MIFDSFLKKGKVCGVILFFVFFSFSNLMSSELPLLEKRFTRLSPCYFVPNVDSNEKSRKIIDNDDVIAFVQTIKGMVQFTSQGVFIGATSKVDEDYEKIEQNFDKKSMSDGELLSGEPQLKRKLIVFGLGFGNRQKNSKSLKPVLKDKTDAFFNYFKGDKDNWHSRIPMYKKLVYPDVWNGIDVEYVAHLEGLEYQVVINPGSNPEDIVMETGAEHLVLNKDGSLTASRDNGQVFISKPNAYQEIDGKIVKVDVSFKILDSSRYSFKLGAYDKSYKLIIDPMLMWSSYLGIDGTGNNYGRAITLDSSRNVYIIGDTYSSFPVTVGAYDQTANGKNDVFVLKLSSDGSRLIFSTYIGGRSEEYGSGIALDSSNNIYIVGNTYSSDFPITSGAYDKIFDGYVDIFVAKLSSDGSSLLYSTYLGGKGDDFGSRIALDSSNNIYIVGNTYSSDFPVTSGAYSSSYNGNNDIVVTKLSSDGTRLIFSTFIGGSNVERISDFSINDSGDIFIVGNTSSTNFPVTSGAYQTNFSGGYYDCFLLELNSDGSDLIFSTYFGTSGDDEVKSMVLDSSNNILITGGVESSDFPVTDGAYDTTFNGWKDCFVTKFSSDGSSILFSTFLGGSDYDLPCSIALDSDENIYVAGQTKSDDFPLTDGSYDTTLNGQTDVFVTKLDKDATSVLSSTLVGGSDYDTPVEFVLDSSNNAYVVGYTRSSNFPTTDGAYNPDFAGRDVSVFVFKLNSSATDLDFSTYIGGDTNEYGKCLAVDKYDNVYITGYTSSFTFPTTNGAYDTDFNKNYDAYVVKLNSYGTDMIYSTFLGGSGLDFGFSIDVDDYGNAYICGFTKSDNFPVTSNAFDKDLNDANGDAFVAKLNSSGDSLLFSTFIGGDDEDCAYSIAVNGSTPFVCGYTASTNFPTTDGSVQPSMVGSGINAFVLRLKSDGSDLYYSTFLGGSSDDYAKSIAVDGNNNAFVVGRTFSSDFPVSDDAFRHYLGGGCDIFVSKINSEGTELLYSTYVGSSTYDYGNSIDIDENGNAYVVGSTLGVFPCTPDAFDSTHSGSWDVVVFKLNSIGSNLIYSTLLGTLNTDRGFGITVDQYGEVYVVGTTKSSDFPVTSTTFDSSYNGDYDGFFVKLNYDGSKLLFSTFLGGYREDVAYSVKLNSSREIWVTGYTESGNFPVTEDALDQTNSSGTDIFISRFKLSMFTITASAGEHGIISPQGTVRVLPGADQSFLIKADEGYCIDEILVDGLANYNYQGEEQCTFTFENVQSNHVISVSFSSNSFEITASAGENGSISPDGVVQVPNGGSQTFEITANDGYHIKELLIDGVPLEDAEGKSEYSYTFDNVDGNHSISVTFDINTYNITASAGDNGSISPEGTLSVSYGSSLTFTFTPDDGYCVSIVTIDGENIGSMNDYTFEDIDSDHSITVDFSKMETDAAPVITSFTYTADSLYVPTVIRFLCSAYDPDGGSIVKYKWHIEGPVSDDVVTYENTLSYKFFFSGEYEVSVSVIDDEGDVSAAKLQGSGDNGSIVLYNNGEVRKMPIPISAVFQSEAEKDSGLIDINTFAVNELGEDCTIVLKALNDSNEVISEESLTVPANGKVKIDPDLFKDIDYKWLEAETNTHLAFYSAIYTENARMTSLLPSLLKEKIFIPHIAEEIDYWDSFAYISNPYEMNLSINVAENSLTKQSPMVFVDLAQMLPEDIEVGNSWGTVEEVSDNPIDALSGFEMFIKKDNDGAATELIATESSILYIPHIPEETDIFWTGFAFLNTNNKDANVTFIFYDDQGALIGEEHLTIPAKTKVKGLMQDMFEEEVGKAKWAIVKSDRPISGIEIYGTYNAGICGYSLPGNGSSWGILPDILIGDDYWTGIAITNVSDESAAVTIQLVSKNGEVKAEKTETILPFNRFKVVIGSYFEDQVLEDGDMIKYITDKPVIAVEVTGDLDRNFLSALSRVE